MKKHIYSYFVILFLLSISLFQCGTEKKEVVLRLKFNENQSLRWAQTNKNHTEYFENDSLISTEDKNSTSESVESVMEILDENTARLKLTYYYDRELPDKNDSSKIIKVSDSSTIEYIQNIHAVNLDIFPHDTISVDKIEYVKKLHQQLAPHYPDMPVTAGYSWSNNIKVMLQNGETNNAITTYTVKGFVKEAGYDCAIIEFVGNTIVPFQSEYECEDGSGKVLETRIDKTKSQGTVYFAYKKGIIVKESQSYEFSSKGTKVKPDGEKKIKITAYGSRSYFLIGASGI